ncbi:Sodium/hydrogen exchanger family-domain-containing protein [Entophlyctis helioformis]|nr:Sodium/hydrogen exchanger family-domain-containing protein [Entophlyctis helioformis]
MALADTYPARADARAARPARAAQAARAAGARRRARPAMAMVATICVALLAVFVQATAASVVLATAEPPGAFHARAFSGASFAAPAGPADASPAGDSAVHPAPVQPVSKRQALDGDKAVAASQQVGQQASRPASWQAKNADSDDDNEMHKQLPPASPPPQPPHAGVAPEKEASHAEEQQPASPPPGAQPGSLSHEQQQQQQRAEDLSTVDLDAIILQRERLIHELTQEKLKLEAANDQGQHNATIVLLESRILRVMLIEDMLRSSLDIFTDILRHKNVTSLEASMDAESLQIIDKFQKLVLRAKNDHLETKKMTEKNVKEKEVKDRQQHKLDHEKEKQQVHQEQEQQKQPKQQQSDQAESGKQATQTPSTLPLDQADGKDGKALAASKAENGTLPSTSGKPASDSSKNKASDIVGDVLSNVAQQADKLESGLNGDTFMESQKSKDTTVETVLKVDDKAKAKSGVDPSAQADTPASMLIDSQNNQYVLSKSGDATAHVEDARLLKDILLLLVTCFACVTLFHVIGLPSFFGYVLAGVLLGPPGYIKNVVQVETISRGLGVIFIMFFLGLEFSVAKIKKVWTVSVAGSAILLLITTLIVIAIGVRLGASVAESFVVGSSLFLSSTAVVLNFLKHNEAESFYGRTIMGILIAQDVLLGFLLALMPALETSGFDVLFTSLRLIAFLAVFLSACALLVFPATRLLQLLLPSRGGTQDIYMLASLGFCLLIISLGDLFGQSVELSCFVAGVMISSRKNLAEATMHVMEPLRGMFAALFFASIGLHIYPSFLLSTGALLVALTALVVVFKAMLTMLMLKVAFRYSWSSSFTVGIGLSQISEFTFVLASKAKSQQILSRESFYILLGVTTLSLLVSPMLWHLGSYIDGRRGRPEASVMSPRRKASTSNEDLPSSVPEAQILMED